ncbi:hypothetical protein BFP77_00995 [Maribacter sp. 4U21]|uniref:hypothetical protein n=1 Tax=Maribacter sp. 4U21 TaxID=1889779 RepID=UPI000C15CBE5|nr:hypothetical protein [Maribacter sp. 4U21]PIB25425.1 hypothetical protein BFP77_00995 [Maribacter sp. 4U21]
MLLPFLIGLLSNVFILPELTPETNTGVKTLYSIEADVPISGFLKLATNSDENTITSLIDKIDKNWKVRYEIMALETLYFSNDFRVRLALRKLLEKKTQKEIVGNYDRTFQYF